MLELAALHAEYGDYLMTYCRKHAPTWEDAEDLAQTVWAKALQTRQRIRNPHAWLTTIAYNALMDLYRHQKRRDRVIERTSLEQYFEEWDERRNLPIAPDMPLEERAFLEEVLIPAWEQCTKEQRRALGLVMAGYGAEEIGPMMGLTRGAGKALLQRARTHFRKMRRQYEQRAL